MGKKKEEGKKIRHDDVQPIDPVGTVDRQWKCQVCGQQGTLDNLSQKSCTRSLSDEEKAEVEAKSIPQEK
jgi:hypothetical protein